MNPRRPLERLPLVAVTAALVAAGCHAPDPGIPARTDHAVPDVAAPPTSRPATAAPVTRNKPTRPTAGSRLYRCARDFDHLLGYRLAIDEHGCWSNYGAENGPQDWHYADADEVLTSYDHAQYVRTWWAGACDVSFADAIGTRYRVWVWAKDEPDRDMAIHVYADLDRAPATAANADREGWYDCGVASMKPGARVRIRRISVDHPRDWSLVKAVYLTTDLSTARPAFDADGQTVPPALGGYSYAATPPVDHDWVLRWTRDGHPYPRALLGSDDVERFRAGMDRPALRALKRAIVEAARAQTWKPADRLWLDGNGSHCPQAVLSAAGYLITGEASMAQQAKLELIAHMRQHALAFHRRPPSNENWDRGNNTLGKFFRQCLGVYDVIAGSGVMNALEDREIRALFASLAYYMERHGDGRWQGRTESGQGYWWWNGNTDRYTAVGLCGLVLPDHPKSRQWIEHARKGLAVQLRHHVRPDGTWPESSNYALVAMLALNTFVRAYANEVDDTILDEPKLKRLYDWHVRTMSPRIGAWWKPVLRPVLPGDGLTPYFVENWPRLGTTARIGQGTGESAWNNGYGAALAVAASIWSRRDAAFAGRLQWAWREWGAPLVTVGELLGDLIATASRPEVKSVPQTLASERVDGYVICRDRFGDPDRELALFVDAQLERAHGVPDFGAYHLYAYGAAITKDWDPSGDPNCLQTCHWNVPWDPTVQRYPWHYATDETCRTLPPTLDDGDVHFTCGADAVRVDYAPAGADGLHRNYLLVKHGPHRRRATPYLVVFDDGRTSQVLRQCCYAAARDVTRTGNVFRFSGHWSVDYEVHYLVEGLNGGADWLNRRFAQGRLAAFQKRPEITMKGRHLLEKSPPAGDWVWIGYPRRRDMGELTATARAIGPTMQRVDVTAANTIDAILLSTRRSTYTEAPLDFDGTHAMIRSQRKGRWTSLTCLGGGHLSDGAQYVEYEGGSISLAFDDITALGDVSGPGGTVRFRRPRWARGGWVLELDAKRTDYNASDGIVTVKVPKGRHTLHFLPADYPRPRSDVAAPTVQR